MNHEDVIAAEADRFAEVLAATDPQARCPTCPDWNAADLLWHLTTVHQFWSAVLAQDLRTDEQVEELESAAPPQPSAIAAMLPAREAATAALVEQLRRLEDDEPRWTWWEPEQTAGFTRRMQVCEATMHRIDAELTARVDAGPIEPRVAALCVDHCVDVMWGWMPDWATWEVLSVAELSAADTGDRWRVEVGHWYGTGPESGRKFDVPGAVRAGAGAPGPDATVTASVAQLARWTWGRQGAAEVTGRSAALDALLAEGIQ